MVKCDYWVNEQVLSCSLNARLLFIGLWNFCDDNGVHPASYLTLKAEVLPVDCITIEGIEKLINELINKHLIREYAVNGKSYWIVTSWEDIQKIDKPTYRYPLPESDLKVIQSAKNQQLLDDNSQINHRVLDHHSASSQCLVGDVLSSGSVILDANEKKGKEKEKKIYIREVETSPIDVASDPTSSASKQVFEHWQFIMNHPGAKFDRKRKQAITKALSLGYSVDDLKQAIDGCKNTPFNMGENERHQVYNDIALILRDAAHIERFIATVNKPVTEQLGNISNDVMMGVI